MSGMNNTSQDPEYVGPTGHEKKFHKTHFQGGIRKKTMTEAELIADGWVRIGVGRWRKNDGRPKIPREKSK